jgi:hypothetical protein
MAEHAVIAHLRLSGGDMGSPAERARLEALEDELEQAIRSAKAGEFDGNEFGGNECVLYMYGPDADRLFATVEGVLGALPPSPGSYVIKRFGAADDRGAREERVDLAG